MEDVAGALGVTKPTVYRLFRDKSALLEACFARAVEPFLLELKASQAAGGTAVERLRRYLVGDLHLMLEDDFGRMLMMPGIVDLYSNQSPTHIKAMQQIRDGVRQIIRDGIRSGEFRKSVNPHLLTFALFATFNRVSRWYDPQGPLSPEEIAEHYFEIFLDGIRADPARRPAAR